MKKSNIKNIKIHNSWRSIRFTSKGKKIGCSKEWEKYIVFYNDVEDSWEQGLHLCRKDKTLPFSKDNFYWTTFESDFKNRNDTIRLNYGGEDLTMRELSEKYKVSLNGMVQRYYSKNNYTTEEIIFSRKKLKKRIIKCSKELDEDAVRTKASKMTAAYRSKDKKRGFENNITTTWLIDNIFNSTCTYCGGTSNIGCDRIDNSLGHTIDNVIPCCNICNSVRMNYFSVSEMKLIGETIKIIYEHRSNDEI